MASLPTRQANQQAILQAIKERQDNYPIGGRLTYAAAVKGKRQVDTPAGDQAAHSIPTNPTSPKDKTINDNLNENQDAHPFDTEDNENPWIMVTRRKQRNLTPKRNPKPKRSKHTEKLMEENRCFKCLDRGHNQFQCRNGVRCINCKGIGHISKRCTIKKTPRTTTVPHLAQANNLKPPREKPPTHPNQTTAPIKAMDRQDWETMPLEDP